MAKHNMGNVIPIQFKRRRNLTEKLAIAILVLQIVQFAILIHLFIK